MACSDPLGIGAQSEARFILEVFKRRWELCKPFHDAQGYDFLIRRTGRRRWESVQVKTCRVREMVKTCQLVADLRNPTTCKPYPPGVYDWLFTVLPGGPCWLIPYETIRGRSTLNPLQLPGYRLADGAAHPVGSSK